MSGSGYTRQSTSSIIPTAVVRAAPINAEYDKLRDAFKQADDGATGHRHDGSADEGSYVPFIADLDKKNHLSVDTSNNRFGVFVEVSSNPVEQIRFQDGVVTPVTDNDIDLGTSSLEFKDLFIDGTAKIDTVSVGDSDNTVITDNTYAVTGDLTFDLSGDMIIDADNADVIIKDGGTQWAKFTNNSGNLDLLSGSTLATRYTGANADFQGTVDVTGNLTADSQLTVAGATALNGGLTMDTDKFTVADTSGNVATAGTLTVAGISTFNSDIDLNGNIDISGNLVVNGTVSTIDTTNTTVKDQLVELGTGRTGSASGDAGIVIERGDDANAFIGFDESADKFVVGTGSFTGASTGDLTVTTGTMLAGLDFTGKSISDGTTAIVGFKDEDDFASDSATHLATQQSIKAYVGTIAGQSNNVVGLTSTAAELNLLDGNVGTPAALTLADNDGILVKDTTATETKNIRADNIASYVATKNASATQTFTNKTIDADATGNNITNIENANIKASAAIDATKIADGTVTNAEFQHINTLSSNAQTQLDTLNTTKASTGKAIAMAIVFG